MATDYQHSPAFDAGVIPVGSIHRISYEQYGKQDGKPVMFLHGGPGGKVSIENTQFFDPTVYRVVLLDQRGCGKSTPLAETRENTSQHLVADIEALRTHLGIEKWHMVFGGSWGSFLALFYAQTHPEYVGSLVLRGVFTLRRGELDFTYGPHGSAQIYPEAYKDYVGHLPEGERADPILAYSKLVSSPDPAVWQPAARLWNGWELSTSKVEVPVEDLNKLGDLDWTRHHAVMETHYFINGGFVDEGHLLKQENIDRIKHIPCSIVQGRLDLVCPSKTAVDLHERWPESKLYMIPRAGHSAQEPGILKKLIEVCDECGRLDST